MVCEAFALAPAFAKVADISLARAYLHDLAVYRQRNTGLLF